MREIQHSAGGLDANKAFSFASWFISISAAISIGCAPRALFHAKHSRQCFTYIIRKYRRVAFSRERNEELVGWQTSGKSCPEVDIYFPIKDLFGRLTYRLIALDEDS